MSTAAALSSPTSAPTASKGLRIALWAVQGLLAFAFVAAGLMKATTPYEELAKNMPWVARHSVELLRFIGVAELLGGLGLLLPALTRIVPVLTPVAASALVLVMALAAGEHVTNDEPGLAINVVLGGLAAFVAWGRFRKAPIAPR